jgi:hypothetical protein
MSPEARWHGGPFPQARWSSVSPLVTLNSTICRDTGQDGNLTQITGSSFNSRHTCAKPPSTNNSVPVM